MDRRSTTAIRAMMSHKDRLGLGENRRRSRAGKKTKVATVMKEYARGTLRSGSGHKVPSRKQAVAIALSEARRAGAKIPKPMDVKKFEDRYGDREV